MGESTGQSFHPFDAHTFEGPPARKKRDVPDGLWSRCPGCEDMVYQKAVTENLHVCPECDHHFRLNASLRIEQLADTDTFEEFFTDIAPADPLDFEWDEKTYVNRIAKEQEKTGNREAVLTGIAYIRGRRVALGVMDGDWLMGSMGSVVGEKITLLIEKATDTALPLIIVCTSGGARMQEGALSLMQMGKTAGALAHLDDAGGLYISVLADPTYGGTSASFAMLADIIVAEPGAMIGFAGQRVIANAMNADLPQGFQSAEFLLEHGFLDMIVHRKNLRSELSRLIDFCKP